MKRQANTSEIFDADINDLLARARVTPPLPGHVRARFLARARASLTVGTAISPQTVTTRTRGVRLAFAVSVAVAVLTLGAAVGRIAALRGQAPRASLPPQPFIPNVAVPSLISQADSPRAPPSLIAKPTLSGERHRARLSSAARETYSAELGLLQRAQLAYAGADFSGALALVREHERRFGKAQLDEEREALRVRSLSGAGRAAEAQGAVAAFAHQFPHSVLLPSLQSIPKELE